MPTVAQALQHLDRELARARQAGCGVVKLVHGYGSTGAGGEIRVAVQRRLAEMAGRVRREEAARRGPFRRWRIPAKRARGLRRICFARGEKLDCLGQ